MSSTDVHKTVKRPDEFLATTQGLFDTLQKNSKGALVVLGVFVALGAAWAVVSSKKASRSDAARDAFYVAQKSLDEELTAMAKVEQGKKKDENAKVPAGPASAESLAFRKLDVDKALGTPVQKLKQVVSEFPGSRSAYDARVALGDLYLNHGEAAKAVAWYEEASKTAPTGFERMLALYALGQAYENQGKPSDAAQAYEKALQLGEGFKGELWLGLARAHEANKDVAKARSIYEQILSQLPNTEYARSAEYFKALLPAQ